VSESATKAETPPAASTGPKTHDAVTSGGSALKRYQQVVVGTGSWARLLYFEWCQLLAGFPGAAGLALRRLFWPRLFGACGKGVMFGSRLTLRHPHRIRLGQRVVLSEGCVLDARTPESDCAIVLGDDVMLANDVLLSCKGGRIELGSHTGLGPRTVVQSTTGNPVTIGSDVFVGAMSYVTGGGNYHVERLDVPMWRQGMKEMGGTSLGDDVWLGAHVSVLGGVTIGSGSIVAAGAVVSKSLPERAVAMGVPARVVRTRESVPQPSAGKT